MLFKIAKSWCFSVADACRHCSNCAFIYRHWIDSHMKFVSHNKVLLILVYVILSNPAAYVSAQVCAKCKLNNLQREEETKVNYEEFTLEHQVSRQDAINVLKTLNQSFFDGPTGGGCKPLSCTKSVMGYCYGAQFINDHCWCEQGHTNEGLPFIPHECYVGRKRYKPSAGSCFFYEEVKECCCSPALAKQWKHISKGSHISPFSSIAEFLLAIIIMCLRFC